MPLPGDPGPGARAMAKQFKVLLPRSFDKLHISDELAGCLNAGDGGGEGAPPEPTALVVSPLGKVWRVKVGRDGDGAFLGRGWAEFLAAHGVGVGWFVVLRHEGGGALNVKVFDTSMCIKEFGAQAAVMTSRSSKGVICKPQFIRIFYPYLSEKMILPARFVKNYVTEECLNSQTAIILSPLGKFWHIELKNDQSGMFFTGVWSQFLEFHGISNGDVLLLRYEGNMVFKFKAFGISGCQKDFKNQNAGIQPSTEKQDSPSPIRKRKNNDERSSSEENKRPKSLVTFPSLKEPYQIGTSSSWIRKKIKKYMLETYLASSAGFSLRGYESLLYKAYCSNFPEDSDCCPTVKSKTLSKKFCNSIGFRITCTITLKTEIDSTRSWQVRGAAYKHAYYITGECWKSFCQDNRLKTGDLCTFNIIKTALWHVTITHSTLADTFGQKESPCSSSRGHKTKKGTSSSEGTKRLKSSMLSLSKVPSYTKSVYDIGPPPWIRKEMNTNSIRKLLSLSRAFCNQIGLPQRCTITLKTSINSNSWQIHGFSRKKSSWGFGSGWKKFCRENNVKVGDVCTFNVIKTTLWHVDITRP